MSKLSILGTQKSCEITAFAEFIRVVHPDGQNVIRAELDGFVFYNSIFEGSPQYKKMVKALQKYLNK